MAAKAELEVAAGRSLSYPELVAAFEVREAAARVEQAEMRARDDAARQEEVRRLATEGARQVVVDRLVEAERQRAVGLVAVEGQAARLGVSFSAADAIAAGWSVQRARDAVIDAMASADEVNEIRTAPTSPSIAAANRDAEVAAGWDAALHKTAARRGRALQSAGDAEDGAHDSLVAPRAAVAIK